MQLTVLSSPYVLELPFSTETYEINLSKGTYILEAYGASGGGDEDSYTTAISPETDQCMYSDEEVISKFKGNAHCNIRKPQPGSGGYAKGTLKLSKPTTIYVNTGGKGQFSYDTVPGGHNGGGNSYIELNRYEDKSRKWRWSHRFSCSQQFSVQ